MNRIALALFISSSITCHAQVKVPRRFAVTSIQVANALMQKGLEVAADQIFLPASIVSSSAEPFLDVDSIEPLRSGLDGAPLRSKIKLVCHSSEMCVPFYAIVGHPLDSVASTHTATVLSDHAVHAALPLSVRAGSTVTLIVDEGNMHIQIPVICLQNGAVGARIHVLSLDHKQHYIATIVSPTLLSGSL